MTRLRFKATLFRKQSGTTALEQTVQRVFVVLARGGFRAMILGGFALQEYGYERLTNDVDVVVDDQPAVYAYLSIRGFQVIPGNTMTLRDRVTRVEVDLLQGGKALGPKQLPLPMPTEVSATPVFVTLSQLLENKLDSYLSNPIQRAKDLGDVVELMKVNHPSGDLLASCREDIVAKYREVFEALWSAE